MILRVQDHICDSGDKLLSSPLFLDILTRCVDELIKRNSSLLAVFSNPQHITRAEIRKMAVVLRYLLTIPAELTPRLVDDSSHFFRDPNLFNSFVEYLYNYWRSRQRLIICDSAGNHFDSRPYRTFNNTIEQLTHVIRSAYRDIQENITKNHPRIYRQVRAGAEVAAIALPWNLPYPQDASQIYDQIKAIPIIRQVLMYPPLIFDTPINKRTGGFERVSFNPLSQVSLNSKDWLCYPAKVGELVIMVYFNLHYFELCFSLSNLFELADDEDLKRQPDAIFLFGTPEVLEHPDTHAATIFFDDEINDILVGTIPDQPKYAYFGYLKKMILTLHNIKMMKKKRLPFHGALFHLSIFQKGAANILIMGDTGAGKSETIEALRNLAGDSVQDLTTIADDMGSLALTADGTVLGYGTEIGAFVRLDDLKPGYAFGQIDRTIIMNPSQINARVVVPVTTLDTVLHGYPIDAVLYANNYEEPSPTAPILERFPDKDTALNVFRAGKVMSKGTTTTIGQVNTYYANIFGPPEYPAQYEALAQEFFTAFFDQGVYVGQMRTCLGVAGQEQTGPLRSAQAIMELVEKLSSKP